MSLIKPGYKTSEFWFTLVTFLFSGLYLLGVIGDMQQKDELISNVTHAVESCILISGQLVVLYKYIKGRSEIKKVWSTAASEQEKEKVNKRKTNVKRTGSTRTKKTSKQNKDTNK